MSRRRRTKRKRNPGNIRIQPARHVAKPVAKPEPEPPLLTDVVPEAEKKHERAALVAVGLIVSGALVIHFATQIAHFLSY